MRSFHLIVRFPGGGPLVGGASTTPYGCHASHAQLPDGRPYLPATALRGALRESLEALLRGTGEHRACAGGDGVDPDHPDPGARIEPGTDRACSLGNEGAPCIACRLFGTRRRMISDAERAFSGLVLADAMPDDAARWTVRPSVALARASRSAANQQLVFRRIPEAAGKAPLTFEARGRMNDASLEAYFEAAVRATTHLGAGRSRGLAQVEIEIKWGDTPAAHASLAIPGAGKDLRLRVTLTSPALVGVAIVDTNYRETRHEIPGSTLRGAVGFALRELVEDADHDQPTQDLLHSDHGARFGFLYPADTAPRDGTDRISGPLPITAAWCKNELRAHGVVDTLLDRLVLLRAASAADAERAAQRSTTRCRCGHPLRGARGSRLASSLVPTRTVVRVAMDRARQSARDGQLFSQVLLAPGVVLEGTIRGIPAHSRQRLAQALGSGIMSFGRGRSAGWGQARMEVEPVSALRSVAERATAFDRALRARLDAAGVTSDRIGRLVPVTLLSPLWPSGSARTPSDSDDDGERDLRDAIGAATCFLSARRFTRDGAWDQRKGQMSTFQATAAGGVFVLELERATWRDVVRQLETLERDGVGQRRDQGFGQVLCFDPHFLISSQNG